MTPQQLKAMKLALEALELLTDNEQTFGALDYGDNAITAIEEVLAEHAMREVQRIGQEIEQEPLEYWNAVEGWVKIDEVRKHFDSVGCGTIYKSAGEGRVPLSLAKAQPEQKPVAHCKVRPLRGDESFPKVEIDWVNQPVPGPLFTAPKPCPTCEALARTVMLDQTSHDTAPPQRTEQTSAERTLQHLGYTNHGGEYWKPPLGKIRQINQEQEPVVFCMHWIDRWGCNHYADPKEPHPVNAKPLYTTPPQRTEQEPVEVDQATMELAESVGLIGPTSRTHDLHQAIQRFHDLICVNATVKAAQMAADVIRESTQPQRMPLTAEQLELLWDEAVDQMEHFCTQYWDFARAIEAAHGIKGGA